MVPHLVTCDDDPAADRRELESLAVWADCLSPVVHIEGDDTLIADVTGCERLFKGEANLLARAVAGLKDQGFSSRGAVADTPGAAWAIAHAHPEPAVVAEPGQTAAELAPLPVWSLRIGPETTAALASVGVETIAALLYLPRSSLTSRFGEELLDRIDQALGNLPEPLIPYRPLPVVARRFDIGGATSRLDVLTEGVRRALERFCKELERRVAGVRQMFVTFNCPDVMTEAGTRARRVTLDVSMSQPTRCARHLFSLVVVVVLDRLELPAPADSVTLWARDTETLDGWQDELFSTGFKDRRELSDLLDRLAVRLGPEVVVSPQFISEHQPELAFRYVSLVGANKTSPTRPRISKISTRAYPRGQQFAPAPRPLRLLPRPVEIAATALVPEGPPIALRLNGTQHTVVNAVGPERIETGWWRGPHVRRDYYRVTTQAGRHAWVFRERDTNKWFLHGWFD